MTKNAAAEYGNYAGGVMNLTARSGTNSFHGTAHEYLRNTVLDANGYFSNLAGLLLAILTGLAIFRGVAAVVSFRSRAGMAKTSRWNEGSSTSRDLGNVISVTDFS